MSQPTQPASESEMHLVFAADEGYAMPLAVSLFSALRHLKNPSLVTVHLLDGGFAPATRQRLGKICEARRVRLVWWDASQTLPGNYTGVRHISKATYLRLVLPKVLPLSVRRVVFLDSDILVMRDVAELAEVDLQGRSIGAIREYAVATVSHPFSGVKDWRELGLPADLPSFNAGIMVMDLERWRSERVMERVMDYIRDHAADLGNGDQDALNAVLAHDWQPLGLEWNIQYALYYLETLGQWPWYQELLPRRRELTDNAAIFHFTGTPKPWNHWCGHPATFAWSMDLLRSGWFSPLKALGWALNYWARRGVFFLTVWGGWRKLRERV